MGKGLNPGRAPEAYSGRIWPPGEGPNAPPPVIPPVLATPAEVVAKADKRKAEDKKMDPRVEEFEQLPDEDLIKLYAEASLETMTHYDRALCIQRLIEAGLRANI